MPERTEVERWKIVERKVKGVKLDAELVALSLPRNETFLYAVLVRNPGAMDGADEWIVWYFNDQDGGLYNGSYGNTETQARRAFLSRGGVFEGMPSQSEYCNARVSRRESVCPYCRHEFEADEDNVVALSLPYGKFLLTFTCPGCEAKWQEEYLLHRYVPIRCKHYRARTTQ